MSIPEAPVTVEDERPIRDHTLGSIGFKEKTDRAFCTVCGLVLEGVYIAATINTELGLRIVHYCLTHGTPLIVESILAPEPNRPSIIIP